jgi:hypothetical protein
MTLKINITTDDGEVLDSFNIDWPGKKSGTATNVDLANKIRERLELQFEVEEDA